MKTPKVGSKMEPKQKVAKKVEKEVDKKDKVNVLLFCDVTRRIYRCCFANYAVC